MSGALAPAAAAPRLAPAAARTRALLEAPIVPTLLHLAWPNLLVMLVQSSIGLIETYFVGWLGTEALAGVALVFPVLMLMQMMSAGAMGGGVSAAIARALGSGRREDADALVVQSLLLALALGAFFTVVILGFGGQLYGALGGTGASLAAALTYSTILFAGAPLLWLLNILASILRGTGNMLVPAMVICGGTLALVPLSPLLILGIGPFPRLGVAGGAIAVVAMYAVGTAALAWYLAAGRSLVSLRRVHLRLRWPLLLDILRVGGVAAINTVLTNLTIVLVTAMIGGFGPAAIAGYGIGSRLEYLLIPLAFGLGAPLVAMVGTNVGAGQIARAERVAWIGAGIAFAVTEAIGLLAAAFPAAWIGLFSTAPEVIATGTTYLRWVGPMFGGFGAGMTLYFSSQGAGRMLWPLLAGCIRMAIAVLGGWLAFRSFGPAGLFAAVGIALLLFGGIMAGAVACGAWRTRR
jgi:putative MATE family efflux protein